jgi:hypothetical protein
VYYVSGKNNSEHIKENTMEANIDLDKLTRDTQRLEYQDGLRDFQIALLFLIIGLGNWIMFTPSGLSFVAELTVRFKAYRVPALFGLIGLVVLLLFGAERWMESIRRKTIWKESGFVKPLRWGTVSRKVLLGSGAAMLGMIIGTVWLMSRGVISEESALRSLPSSVGVSTAIIFVGVGMRLEIQRYLWVGLLGLILSGTVFFSAMSLGNAYLLIGTGWGVILGLSGSWALRKAIIDLREGVQNG